MGMNINQALQAYSHSFGNRLDDLRSYCREHAPEANVEQLARHFDRLQNEIFDQVVDRSQSGQLTGHEIEAIARAHLLAEAPEVDDRGLRAIMDWVAWMAWHEGYLKT